MNSICMRAILAAFTAMVVLTAHTAFAQVATTATTSPALKIQMMGTPQIFLDHSKFIAQGSRDDMPPHAYRDSKGLIHFFGANSYGYPFVGTSFDTLAQAKKSAWPSVYDPDPTHFNYKDWISTAYATGGDNVYGILHNEYHGMDVPAYKDACALNPKQGSQTCWYVATVLATSSDGGVTFHEALGPKNLLFGIPYQFSTDMVRAGIDTAVIIKNPHNDYYYAMPSVVGFGEQQFGVCVARSTDNLKTWRFWNGTDWSGTFVNPYLASTTPESHVCPPVIPGGNGGFTAVIYDERDDLFVGFMGRHGPDPARLDTVFSYLTSRDLIHWSQPVDFFTAHDNGDKPISYPSLLDLDSSSINFDVTDGTRQLSLFYVSWPFGAGDNLHRDVMRVPVRLVIPDTERPTITFLTPSPDELAVASGTIRLRTNADDDRSIAGVQFMLDGQKLGPEATSSTEKFAVAWDTTTADNGIHRLQAIARDRAGNTRTATTSVHVINRTQLSITTDAASTTVGAKVRIMWHAISVMPDSCAVTFIPRDSGIRLPVDIGEYGSILYGPLQSGGRFFLTCKTRAGNDVSANVHVAVHGAQ